MHGFGSTLWVDPYYLRWPHSLVYNILCVDPHSLGRPPPSDQEQLADTPLTSVPEQI